MTENIIELEHVDAGYPGKVILHDVTFSIRRGEVFILLGGSGCGKSTIMKHMIGLNPVLAGHLRVAGLEWSPRTRQELCRKIGVMYQSGALFGSMTCLENVMLPLEEFTKSKRRERVERAMARLADVDLADAAEDHRASSKSAPRTIYGRIVAEADRDIVPFTIILRTVQFGLAHYPELSKEEHYSRAVQHMHEKYADGGYLKLWIPESPNAARLEELRCIIRDGESLRNAFEKAWEQAAGDRE